MLDPLYPAAQIAERLGVTERTLMRFAKKHAVQVISPARGVYRFSEAAVHQLEDAACPTKSVSLSERTAGRLGSLPGRRTSSKLDTVLELTQARERVRQKVGQRSTKSSATRP